MKNFALFLLVFSLIVPPSYAAEEKDEDRGKENISTTFNRHRTLGLISAPLMAVQLGIGAAILTRGENPPSHSLRAIHTLTSLALLGISASQFFDGKKIAGKKKFKTKHGKMAYHYLISLGVTGLLGIAQSRLIKRESSAYDTMKYVHGGAALASGTLFTMTLLHAPL